jgi:hypothetical protein
MCASPFICKTLPITIFVWKTLRTVVLQVFCFQYGQGEGGTPYIQSIHPKFQVH